MAKPATPKINPKYAKDAREVYLLAFDVFATDPSEIASELGLNIRYARELLGMLVHAGLLTAIENGDGEDAWQVINPGTYDTHDRAEAEKVIDAWLAETKPQAKRPEPQAKTRATSTSKTGAFDKDGAAINCLCGCGLQVQGKARYKPGHDARHAGQVGRRLAQDVLAGTYKTLAAGAKIDPMDGIDSPKLRAKVRAIAERTIAKTKSGK